MDAAWARWHCPQPFLALESPQLLGEAPLRERAKHSSTCVNITSERMLWVRGCSFLPFLWTTGVSRPRYLDPRAVPAPPSAALHSFTVPIRYSIHSMCPLERPLLLPRPPPPKDGEGCSIVVHLALSALVCPVIARHSSCLFAWRLCP